MKTESENAQRWDDIIFEKRNKAYGAYSIRKDYNNNVLKAEVISIGIGVLIFMIPLLSQDEQIINPIIKDLDKGLVIQQFPDIKPIDPPLHPTPPATHSEVVPTQVTTEEVIEKPIEPTAESNASGTESSTVSSGQEQIIESAGAGTLPVIESKPAYYTVVEHMPEYEGGVEGLMKFLQKKLRYPAGAVSRGEEGTVYVSFIISSSGAVTNVEVIRGISRECDKEAIRVISMMNKWKPGIQNKMPVAVKMVLPIKFKLDS